MSKGGVEISEPMIPYPYPVFLHVCLCSGGSDNVEAFLMTQVFSDACHCLDVDVCFQGVFGCYFWAFGCFG